MVVVNTGTDELIEIEIVDMYGKTIWKEDVLNKGQFDVSTWNSAVYFVQIKRNNQVLKTTKLVVH
jgi:hypothetical protein